MLDLVAGLLGASRGWCSVGSVGGDVLGKDVGVNIRLDKMAASNRGLNFHQPDNWDLHE